MVTAGSASSAAGNSGKWAYHRVGRPVSFRMARDILMSEGSGAYSCGTVFILSRGKEAISANYRLHSDLSSAMAREQEKG